jgi:CheY-like chemotaxis protein
MGSKVLIVEDEIFVALEVESVVLDMGHVSVGIAADSQVAKRLGEDAEIALVDLNLKDGATGKEIGAWLASRGVAVIFTTANPSQLGAGVPRAIGVLAKPVDDAELQAAIAYATALHGDEPRTAIVPPRRLRLFPSPAAGLAAQPTG